MRILSYPRSRLLKAMKPWDGLFHRPRIRSHTRFLHLKFLSKIEATTTKLLELPEYWQLSDFVQN